MKKKFKNLFGKRRGIRLLLLLSMMTVCSCLALFAAGCDQGSVGMGQGHEHDWGEWQITKHATCSLEGQKKRVCKSDPSHVETVTIEIDPTAHDFGPWGVTREPTCSIAGEKTRTCRRDHSHTETAAIETDPKAHDFGPWEVTKEPTCSAAGEKTRVCKRDPSHKETAAIETDPKAHSWDEGKVLKEPTCKESGEKVYTCLYDSKHTKKEAIAPDESAHVLGEWIEPVSSTCEKNGVPGHYECKNCGAFFDEQKKELENTKLPLLDHDFEKWVEGVEPTCEKTGTRGYYKCKNCKGYYDENKNKLDSITLSSLNHDYQTKEVKCGCEIGDYEVKICKVCGKSSCRQTSFAGAHKGEGTCSRCGLDFTAAYAAYIKANGIHYVPSDNEGPSGYRIVHNEVGASNVYYQFQWFYLDDGTVEWRIYGGEGFRVQDYEFCFYINWKKSDVSYTWSFLLFEAYAVMDGTINPHYYSTTQSSLSYQSVEGVYLDSDIKSGMSQLAAMCLGILLAKTEVNIVPPEGFDINNFGFTKVVSAQMPHNYTLSSEEIDNKTKSGKLNFSCSHCSEKRTVEFDLDANASALCSPATSDALHASPLEGETLFQERKFCFASDFKRPYKRRVR